MDDNEFDLPNAEEYFPLEDAKTIAVMPPELLDEFDDDDLFDGGRAGQKCLAIPELLEHMLLYVPPLEIYKLQRVNTFFRDVISRSIPIRRHMYFVPDKYFVRNDLNRLMNPRHGEDSRLAKALYPLRLELYASRNGPGVGIGLADGWLAQEDKTHPSAIFPETRQTSVPDRFSWQTILISDSTESLEVALQKKTIRNEGEPMIARLQGQVTLGDVVLRAKQLTVSAWSARYTHRQLDALCRLDDCLLAMYPEIYLYGEE